MPSPITDPIAIPAFNDNYIWAIMHPKSDKCYLVDPGDGAAVHAFLANSGKSCAGVLITHHHSDHIGAVAELKQQYNCPIITATDERCLGTEHLIDGDSVNLFPECSLKVIAVPGHTSSHIAFYGNNWLFCGDTLFSAGCGRVLCGSYEELFASLEQFKQLPDNTKVYCAHEYTLSNIKFALTVEPNNQRLQAYQQECLELRNADKITLPSNIGLEKQINPFLRCDKPEVIASACNYAKKDLRTPLDVFKVIRKWKDTF